MEQPMIVILCSPVASCPSAAMLGASKTECVACKENVWIAPSSRDMVGKGAVPHCVECGQKLMKSDAGARLEPPTPEQLAEIEANRK